MTERSMAERDAERDDGYYWALEVEGCDWTIVHWFGYEEEWFMPGEDRTFSSDYFLVIDERRIVRPAE